MAYQLIPQDGVLRVYDGGVFTGVVTPTWVDIVTGVLVTYKNLKISEKYNTLSTRGAGDVQEYLRPTFKEWELSCDLMIANTGLITITPLGYGQITFQPGPGLAVLVYTGLWTEHSLDISADNPQMQTITLKGGFDTV